MSESARSILKHLYKEGRMTEEQYHKIDRNLKEQPQWIPCTDRLPEKTGYYLVSDRRGDVYSTNFDYLRGEMCFGYDDLDGCFIKDDTVIAWMPLPTPYMKEGEKDAKDPGNR